MYSSLVKVVREYSTHYFSYMYLHLSTFYVIFRMRYFFRITSGDPFSMTHIFAAAAAASSSHFKYVLSLVFFAKFISLIRKIFSYFHSHIAKFFFKKKREKKNKKNSGLTIVRIRRTYRKRRCNGRLLA